MICDGALTIENVQDNNHLEELFILLIGMMMTIKELDRHGICCNEKKQSLFLRVSM